MNRIILPAITFICALMIVCLLAFGATAGLIVLGLLVPLALCFGLFIVAVRHAVERAIKWKRGA